MDWERIFQKFSLKLNICILVLINAILILINLLIYGAINWYNSLSLPAGCCGWCIGVLNDSDPSNILSFVLIISSTLLETSHHLDRLINRLRFSQLLLLITELCVIVLIIILKSYKLLKE